MIRETLVIFVILSSSCSGLKSRHAKTRQPAPDSKETDLCVSNQPNIGSMSRVFVVRRMILRSETITKLKTQTDHHAENLANYTSGIEIDYLVEGILPNSGGFTIGDTKASKDLRIDGRTYSETTAAEGEYFHVTFIIDDVGDYMLNSEVDITNLSLNPNSNKFIVKAIYLGGTPPASGIVESVLDVGWNQDTERHLFNGNLACFLH